MKWPDRISALVLLGAAIFLYIVQLSYPREGAFFPKVLIISLALLSISLLIQSWFKKDHEDKKKSLFEQEEMDVFSTSNRHSLIRITNVMGLSIAYIVLMHLIGYVFATGVFIVLLAFVLKMRKIYILIPTAAGLSIGIYIAFKVFLKLPLPQGLIFS